MNSKKTNLILTLNRYNKIVIHDIVEIYLSKKQRDGHEVRIMIRAPEEVKIKREERDDEFKIVD